MAASGLSCKKSLGQHWVAHFSPPLLEQAKKMVFWPCRASISDGEAIWLICKDDHWSRAVTIASLLDSGCGVSHEYAQDGCNGTCTGP